MFRRGTPFLGLWLVAALFGFSVLLPADTALGRERAATADVSSTHAAAARQHAALGGEPFAPAHLRRVSPRQLVRALPRTSAPASLFRPACVLAPGVSTGLLRSES